MKAIGKGLSIPLDSFAVGLGPPRLLRADPRHGAPGDWLFHVHQPTARHVLALAFARRAGRRMQIDGREVTLAQLASVPHA
jgi:hypothetical protein